MNQALSGRAIFRALLPAVAMVFFIVDAVRSPQRVFFSVFCALLAASVLYSRLKPKRPR